jgi:hypothetical protein
MRLIKVFKFSEMPNSLSEKYKENFSLFCRDRYNEYVVGMLIEKVNEKGLKNGPVQNFANYICDICSCLDSWLIAHGATKGETVLLEVG